MARTYDGKAIPNKIRVTELVKDDVESGRLSEEDERATETIYPLNGQFWALR